jgi:glycine cleavage system H protein
LSFLFTVKTNPDPPLTMNIPADLRYAKTHEWIRVEGETVTVGITDHAQAELTDIVYAEPPKVGAAVTAGGTAAVVESVKAASDIYSPLTGTVTEVNGELSSNPALLNTDPFGQGWIYRMTASSPAEIETLLTPEAYSAQIAR